MRVIKFRGKRLDNGQWVYGDLVHQRGTYIRDHSGRGWIEHEVDPKTVGQYTGLKDKNGVEIYEGDVVKLHCGEASSRNGVTATIVWREEKPGFGVSIHDKKVVVKGGTSEGRKERMSTVHSWTGMHNCFSKGWGYIEVIGTIYENPELLEQSK